MNHLSLCLCQQEKWKPTKNGIVSWYQRHQPKQPCASSIALSLCEQNEEKTWFHTHFCLHFILRIKSSVPWIRCLFIYLSSISFFIRYGAVCEQSERRRKKSAIIFPQGISNTLISSRIVTFFSCFKKGINTIALASDCYLSIPILYVFLSSSFHLKRIPTWHNVANFHISTNFHFNNIDHKMCVIIL